MFDEIDVQEVVGLLLGESAFDGKEAMAEQLRARARNRRREARAVVGARMTILLPSRKVSAAEY